MPHKDLVQLDHPDRPLVYMHVSNLRKLLDQMGPIAEYYRKLREWDGGCALPKEPSNGEVLDLIEAYDKWRDRVK